jgi:hypothetical protein
MVLRRKKSRRDRVTQMAADYLKLKAAGKAAKGAGKGASKAAKGAGKGASKTAKGTALAVRKSSKARRAGVVAAGAGVLAVVAAKLIRDRSSGEPSPA